MSGDQLVGLVANVVIYAGVIAFVLYRQMSAQPVRGLRLVVLPAVLGLLGLEQLVRQPLVPGAGMSVLGVGLVIGLAVGVWRGTTFRVWAEAGRVLAKGTAMTLVTWAVLIVVRLPFAFLGFTAHRPRGFVIGELLLVLGATFGAQNAMIWVRANRVDVGGLWSTARPGDVRR
ncbi:hypothetical protein GCM10009630_57980 [Kribbella jejuensis]|uniref:Uncharacterized protein DUF1453 n=1 Tax=Kribbella jejuensis TaxID=236068 RepID=A0A542ENF9_9ACTN|nr:DUF1453 family protein [Kribbella jejuensis]TQJ16859.1 uncharacterized protein DUF1453 [Kribbella jejuensis]